MTGEFRASADEVICQEFVELVTDYLEGTLPTGTLSHVEEHLVICDWCVTYVDQMHATIASLAALREGRLELPDALVSALRAKREGRR